MSDARKTDGPGTDGLSRKELLARGGAIGAGLVTVGSISPAAFAKAFQAPKPKRGGYYQDRYISSFIAAAPFDRPKIAVVVVIEDPDKYKLGYNRYGGGAIAGPAAVRIINETLQYMGVPALPPAAPGTVASAQ